MARAFGNPEQVKVNNSMNWHVPSIIFILFVGEASTHSSGGYSQKRDEFITVQATAVIGSFACGLESRVMAVLEAEVFPLLSNLISHPIEKVVDDGAHSLKLIYQSRLFSKFDFLKEKIMKFLIYLLNSKNE
ncbi:ARM repeat superfamily protein [Abeliophyllum distichum]|uniref:ARM repeat superfamily protein n=1 Tax=Abeliophyllum distichum TaxID=126358 RepID=A0ABD1VA80_9LAMI